MKNKTKKTIFRVVTAIVAVTILVLSGYIMFNRLGLVEGYDFGGGAYYYVDIPDFNKIVDENAYQTSVPVWVHVVLFIGWGWLMWRLWCRIDGRK